VAGIATDDSEFSIAKSLLQELIASITVAAALLSPLDVFFLPLLIIYYKLLFKKQFNYYAYILPLFCSDGKSALALDLSLDFVFFIFPLLIIYYKLLFKKQFNYYAYILPVVCSDGKSALALDLSLDFFVFLFFPY